MLIMTTSVMMMRLRTTLETAISEELQVFPHNILFKCNCASGALDSLGSSKFLVFYCCAEIQFQEA